MDKTESLEAFYKRKFDWVMLVIRDSSWNISEIAYALGLKEVTHFNNFFKKYVPLSPSKFRKQ